MKKLSATILAGAATVGAVIGGAGPASAATDTADVAAYLLPTTPGSGCTIGITNNGPDTVNIGLGPSNSFLKVYYRDIGPLAPGKSAKVDYAVKCEATQADGILIIAAFGYNTDGSGQANDPNQLNNYVVFTYPPAAPPSFGSS